MNWPTSQDFNEAIQDPSCLADPDLKSGEVVANAMGLPVPRSGNFADVYQFQGGDGTMWAVKLFTRKVSGLQERYAKIDAHLAKAQFPFTVGFKFHQQGIRIKGQHFPLLKMEWVEGFTLNDFVAANLGKPHYLHALMQMWAKLCGRLRDANFAHADLQHGNVLLVPGATPQKLGLKLIDYDGMWVPALAESHSGEVGHPNFQHPLRLKDRLYNADVDRFPHLVIAAALRGTLVGGKPLWDKFDNADNLLFKEADLRDPANAPVFKALWNLNDPVLRTLVGHIVLNVKQPLRKTPWLDDVLFEEGGPRLTSEQLKQAAELLGVRTTDSATHALAAPEAMQEEFNVFRFMDDDAPPAPGPTKSGPRRAPVKSAKKSKEEPEEPRKSKTPWLIGGGVLAVALVGGIVALTIGSGKGPTHPEIAKNDPELHPQDNSITNDGENLPKPKDRIDDKNDVPIPRADIPPATVIGVAAIPKSGDYLFIRQDDPVLYRVQGAGKQPQQVGNHQSAIRALAVTADASRALTGAEDGTIHSWSLKGPAKGARLLAFPKIESFTGDFGYESYDGGVLLRNNSTRQEAFVPAGEPGHEVKGAFRQMLASKVKDTDMLVGDRMGEALSAESTVLDGALIVQVFQGGTMLRQGGSGKRWYAYHRRRKVEPAPAIAGPQFKEHTRAVVALAVSPDGARAVSVGQDRLLCEWNLAEARLVRKITIPLARAIAFLPDGKSVLLGTEKGPIGLWELEKQAPEKELTGHNGPINALCVSAKGDRAFSAGDDGTVRSWSIATGTPIQKFAYPHAGGAYAVALAPDESILVSGGKDHTLRFYDAFNGKVTGGIGWKHSTYSIDFFDQWQDIVVGLSGDVPPRPMQLTRNEQGTVHTAPPRTVPTQVEGTGALVELHAVAVDPGIERIGYAPDGKLLYAIRKGSVAIHEGDTGKELKRLPLEGVVRHVLLLANKQLCVAVDDRLQVWDWDKIQRLHDADWMQNGSVRGIVPTADPNRVLVVSSSPNMIVWDVIQWKQVERVAPRPSESCMHAAPHPDKTHFVLAFIGPNGDTQLAVWDLSRWSKVVAFEPTDLKNVTDVDVSPNGKWVVAISRDTQHWMHIWDAATGKRRHVLPMGRPGRLSGGFTRGGGQYIVSEAGGRRYAVDLGEGKPSADLLARGVSMRSATLDPAAGRFASLDVDSKLRLWRVELDDKTPQVAAIPMPKSLPTEVAAKEGLIQTSPTLSDTITGCEFSGDGKKLFVSTYQGMVHVLDAATLQESTKVEVAKGRIYHMILLPKSTLPPLPERLYLLDDNKQVHVWDAEKSKSIRNINLEKSLDEVKPGHWIAVTPSDSNLMVFSESGKGELAWDIRRAKQAVLTPLQRAPFNSDTRCVGFSQDGRVGAAYASGKLLVWNARTSRDIKILDTPETSKFVGLLPDVNAVVGASRGRLQAWDYVKGKELLDVAEPHRGVSVGGAPFGYWTAVTPKGSRIVTAGSDREFRVWDVRTGKEVINWRLQRSPVSVTVSPDGEFAAVSHTNPNLVSLWRLPPVAAVKKP